MRVSNFPVTLNYSTILRLLNCNENNPLYNEFFKEIIDLEPEINKRVHPDAVFTFCDIPEKYSTDALPSGTPVICVLATIGAEISNFASELFEDGDCVRGMIVDAAADDFLFQIDRFLQDSIKQKCAGLNMGISGRLEVPDDIPFFVQKMIWEQTHALEELNVSINESFMMNPVKSNCYIYKLTNDESMFKIQHDCSNCSATTCKLRHVSSL